MQSISNGALFELKRNFGRQDMSVFGPSKWEINALVIISAQLASIQRKLDALLNASTSVSPEQLKELRQESQALHAKAEALAQAIEKQKG